SGGLLNSLTGYMEGMNKLSQAAYITLPVEGLSATEISEIVSSSKLIMPFDKLTYNALINQSYASKGLTTVGEYFNAVSGAAALNIVAFILLFVLVRVILGVIINAADFKQSFPVLKHYDSLIGGIVGLLQGLLFCFVLFTLAPIVLSILNQQAITAYLDESLLGSFFYNSNFILVLIRGVV
ncbi:CvpA family protein, partial [Eubacteriales bacterium OttesenSCG-928-N14]|nr:CvpA family protein [Eubacteriales bacterium OttesenSCG-928-N14]